jgi:prolipoprotein diacylglyceryl transferase
MEFQREWVVLFDRVQIRYYGIIIVLAMLVAASVAARLARRDGRDPDHIWGALTWAIIPAIIGARLWFVLFPPASLVEQGMDTGWFFQNFFNLENGAIAIWSGGLSIFGAAIGGFLGAYLYLSPLHNRVTRVFSAIGRLWRIIFAILGVGAIVFGVTNQSTPAIVVGVILLLIVGGSFVPWIRKNILLLGGEETRPFPAEGLPVAPWLDIAAVALPLGQAIGRWANFVNQELYGVPTTLPWGITIDASHRVAPFKSLVEYPLDTGFHPLFLYESLWSLLAFIVLLNIFLRYRNRLPQGDIFILYLLQYSVIRFILEGIRVEVTYIPGTEINLSQVFMGIVFVISLLALVYRHRSGGVPAGRTPDPKPVSENT